MHFRKRFRGQRILSIINKVRKITDNQLITSSPEEEEQANEDDLKLFDSSKNSKLGGLTLVPDDAATSKVNGALKPKGQRERSLFLRADACCSGCGVAS